MPGDPRVAVAMITWNRREQVLRTLQRLIELPERPPIVLVDNGSTDGTRAAVAERFPQVDVVRSDENLGAAGRNVAVRCLERPYVAFCDDDTWWEPGSLSRAADLFETHHRLALVTARVLIEPGGRVDPTCRRMQRSPLARVAGMPGPALLGFLGGASVVRRSAFLEAGGYPAAIWLGGEEDWLAAELASRGWRLCYVSELCVHHEPCLQRNEPRRRWHLVRNALWFAWLRRPLGSALRRTAAIARTEPWDAVTLKGFAAAVAGLAPLLPQRKVVPRNVERGLRLLEQVRDTDPPSRQRFAARLQDPSSKTQAPKSPPC